MRHKKHRRHKMITAAWVLMILGMLAGTLLTYSLAVASGQACDRETEDMEQILYCREYMRKREERRIAKEAQKNTKEERRASCISSIGTRRT